MFLISLFTVLVIFMLWAIYAASGALSSNLRQRSAKKWLGQAQLKAREGDLSGSLNMFLKAESRWTLDAAHRSHSTTLSDLDQYAKIAAGIANAVGREAASTHNDIRATLREMRELAPNRSNFGVDAVGKNVQVQQRWEASCERLKTLRAKLRETCQPKLIR